MAMQLSENGGQDGRRGKLLAKLDICMAGRNLGLPQVAVPYEQRAEPVMENGETRCGRGRGEEAVMAARWRAQALLRAHESELLRAHESELHALAGKLLEKETLTGAQIKQLIERVRG